jgi:YesN/AraC family two-component response regulator
MDEVLIGFLMIGQFRTSTQPLNLSINNKWKKVAGNDELCQAFEATPYYSNKNTEYILKLFNILVDYILYQHMIELYGNNSIQPLMNFMQIHMEENLDLSEGAKILMQSKSSLAHKFKNTTGKSFKRYQIDLKLDKADEYFKKQPEMTIREVAYRLGYQDPYYFSRLYKKHRGQSPLRAKIGLRKPPADQQ